MINMPNWCSTHIEIVGANEEIELLHSKISRWFGEVGNSNLFDIAKKADINTNDCRCRGSLEQFDLFTSKDNEKHIELDTETAWVPMIKMWRKIIEKYAPSAKIYWIAEESGCDLFQTNDIEYERFDWDYVLNYSLDSNNIPFSSNKLQEFFSKHPDDFLYYSADELIEKFKEEFGKREIVIMRKLKELDKNLENGKWFYIHEFIRDNFEEE